MIGALSASQQGLKVKLHIPMWTSKAEWAESYMELHIWHQGGREGAKQLWSAWSGIVSAQSAFDVHLGMWRSWFVLAQRSLTHIEDVCFGN